MSKVSVTKDKLDILANAIANKSGEPLTLTLDEMVSAVDGIDTSGGGITPTGNINITQAGVTDVTNYATATVPQGEIYVIQPFGRFKTVSNVRKWEVESGAGIEEIDEYGHAGYVADGTWENVTREYNAVPSGTTITPTTSSQTIGGANYMMEGAVTVNAMPTGSATAPTTISGTAATVSTGTNTLTLSKTVSNTPQVTAGYISSGTAGNSSVSLTANVTTKGTATITPTTSNQTIASGTYITGTQTISGDANLVAGNIKSGTTIFGVTGTYTGGGGSSDIATGTLTVASNVNTSTNTAIATTTTIGFTPTKFLFYRSDRSATSNHVNQASFVTLGTSYYVRTMTRYSSNALSTSGNTNNWTTQTSGYLYFNNNTVYFRSSSSYILPSGTWYWVAVK